jgi:hypothetical protein
MSSILHNQLNPFGSRARRALATAVIGLGLTSGGCVVASAVPHAPAGEGSKTTVSIAPYHTEMPTLRAYEAKGYVPTACTIRGTLLINPHTHRSVTIAL